MASSIKPKVSDFDPKVWFEAFVIWMQGRSEETIEIVTDAAAELYLNCLTAQHLRLYGRTHGPEKLWARREWGLTDISFGKATRNFTDTVKAWDSAWKKGLTGDLGQIEAKLVYSLPNKDTENPLQVVAKQLEVRHKRDCDAQKNWPTQNQ